MWTSPPPLQNKEEISVGTVGMAGLWIRYDIDRIRIQPLRTKRIRIHEYLKTGSGSRSRHLCLIIYKEKDLKGNIQYVCALAPEVKENFIVGTNIPMNLGWRKSEYT